MNLTERSRGVVPGDRVTIGVSPYDPTKGLIVYRAK